MRVDLRPLLETIAKTARAEILKDFRADSCIASTRTVIRVLHHFGYNAVPCPVQLMVFNQKFIEAVNKSGWPSMQGDDFIRWCDETGAWSVGVGTKIPGETVVGHLVAVLEKKRFLIDASLDQANRPNRGIVLPGTVVGRFKHEFLYGKPEVSTINGCAVRYIKEPSHNLWVTSRDWMEDERTQRATDAIIKHVERRLENVVA